MPFVIKSMTVWLYYNIISRKGEKLCELQSNSLFFFFSILKGIPTFYIPRRWNFHHCRMELSSSVIWARHAECTLSNPHICMRDDRLFENVNGRRCGLPASSRLYFRWAIIDEYIYIWCIGIGSMTCWGIGLIQHPPRRVRTCMSKLISSTPEQDRTSVLLLPGTKWARFYL